MKEILKTDSDQGDEADIEDRVKISAQSSFSDSGLGGNTSDTEDIERGLSETDFLEIFVLSG